MASADHRAERWYDLTKSIRALIRESLINSEIDIQHCTFVTRSQLDKAWNDDLFNDLKSILSSDHLNRSHFFFYTVSLVSALINYQWSPVFGADKLQDRGLFISALDRHLTNEDLPLQLSDISKIFGYNADDFKDGQHAFKPAFIDDQFCSFPEGTRLPFKYVNRELPEKRSGWYGEVVRVKVDEDCYHKKLGFNFSQPVACKTIKYSRDNFLQELKNLQLIGRNAIKSDHIVTHIVAVLIEPSKFHIIFPWAWADLAYFLHLDPQDYPPWLKQYNVTLQTLLDEVGDVAQAVDFLHNKIDGPERQRVALYHMDLKPNNILIFEPSDFYELKEHPLGLWKITDFGVSDSEKIRGIGDLIGSSNIPSSSPSRPLTRESGPHQAPEVERLHGFRNIAIDHAKADVWSYGMVLTEVLAFAVEGSNGVRTLKKSLVRSQDGDGNFRSGYPFQVSEGREYMLHPALTDWFESTERVRPWWTGDIWRWIKKHTLCIDPGSRSSADHCRDFLRAQSVQLRVSTIPVFPPTDAPAPIDVSPDLGFDREPVLQLDTPEGPNGSVSTMPALTTSTRQRNSLRESVGSAVALPAYRGSGSLTVTDSSRPWSVFATRSSWQDSTICQHQQSRTSFTEHLSKDHFSKKGSKFVALSSFGSHAIFSDGRHLCRARIHPSLPGGIQCAGEIERNGRGDINLEAIKFSSGYVAVHDTNDRIILQSMNDSVFALASTSDRRSAIQRSIVRFHVAPNGRMAIEYSDSVEVFDPNGQRRLYYLKEVSLNLLGLVFDKSGDTLFAVSRKNYLIWNFDAATQKFLLRVTKHTLISEAQSIYAMLIPLGRDSACLMQDIGHPTTIYVFSPLACRQLSAEGPDYYASSRLLPLYYGVDVICLGHRKRSFPKGWSSDVLLKLDVNDDARGRSKLSLSSHVTLPEKLQKHATIETAICILQENPTIVQIVEAVGKVHEINVQSS